MSAATRSARTARPRTAIIGAGRLAAAIGTAAWRRGYPIVAVASRRPAAARRLARLVPPATATVVLERAVEPARLILLAVPDGSIAVVARDLAARVENGWSHRTVLHHAGSLGPEVLAPLARRGAGVGVLHPMQCLGDAEIAAEVLPGSAARVEGDRRGRSAARRLATDLGLRVLPMKALRPGDRMAYHAAASLVSNDLVALLSLRLLKLVEETGDLGPERRRALRRVLEQGS